MAKTLFVAFLFPLISWAHPLPPNSEFSDIIEEYQNCSSQECPFEEVELLDFDKNQLAEQIFKALAEIATSQARVWADTILEGDYISVGETQLNHVMGILRQGQLVGYHIIYSEPAYYTGSCDYDYENEETLSECSSGSISEETFVSADLQTYFVDENSIADFSN